MTPDVGARRPASARRVVAGLLPLVVVVAVLAYLLPQFADVSQVWAAISGMTWLEVLSLVAAALLNLATYGLLMVGATPGLRFSQAMVVTESSTAVANTLPGGGALGVAMSATMLRSWGFSPSRVTVSVLVSGLWNTLAKLGLPVVAMVCLAVQGDVTAGRLVAAAGGVAGLVAAVLVLWAVIGSERAARRLGLIAARVVTRLRGLVGRGPVTGWDRATTKFRARTALLLRARWLVLSVVTLASHLALFAVLLLALRHAGVSQQEVSWVEALAVFAFARLLTAVPITPGGVGVVEVALVAGLVRAGGANAEVVAAVLVFRALTYVVPVPLGLLTYLFWRRDRVWRRAPGGAPRTDLVPEAA